MVVALSAMGLVALWFGFVLRKQANAARGWPQVTARIIRSKVDFFDRAGSTRTMLCVRSIAR